MENYLKWIIRNPRRNVLADIQGSCNIKKKILPLPNNDLLLKIFLLDENSPSGLFWKVDKRVELWI